jgi:Ca2+-binding RTX toxin-like protein
VELSNVDIIEQISHNTKSIITGLVEHFYLTTKVDDLRHSSDMLRYIDKDLKHWLAEGYGDKDFIMTEWNIQADNQEQFGLKGAGALLFQFESMVRMGFSEAYTWPILSGNTTELAGDIKGEPYLTPAGAALQHMAKNIKGLKLLELQELGSNLEVSGYGHSDKVVLYISSRDVNKINLSADLSAVTNGLRLSTAQSISVDKSNSDGVHRLKNGTQVDVAYYSENDLNASVRNLDESLIFNNQIINTELEPYEILALIFERKAITSAVSYTLSTDDFELTLAGNMAINGTGNDLNNVLTGNSAANRLIGGAGDDILSGLAGADTLSGQTGDDVYVIDSLDFIFESLNGGNDRVEAGFSYALQANFENLTLLGTNPISGKGNQVDNVLVGNNAANAISGEGGNDTLDGGTGADTLAGGPGNDTYYIDLLDKVTESKDMGTDTVISTQTYKLGLNVENLTLSGDGHTNGTGNLMNNILVGSSGNNVLDGVSGRDTMIGGAGDDNYYTNGLDNMIEGIGQGLDKVFASVSHSLFVNIENLTLVGTSNLNGTGNALDNVINGNLGKNSLFGGEGDDTLDGGIGSDTLSGGPGEDVFIFTTSVGNTVFDAIKDFNIVDDSIGLSAAIFTNIGSGALDPNAFRSNGSGRATDATDRVIYETDTGKLFFDVDGSGSKAGVLFAQLAPELSLTWEHIFLF